LDLHTTTSNVSEYPIRSHWNSITSTHGVLVTSPRQYTGFGDAGQRNLIAGDTGPVLLMPVLAEQPPQA
jgi:hypothetical protein